MLPMWLSVLNARFELKGLTFIQVLNGTTTFRLLRIKHIATCNLDGLIRTVISYQNKVVDIVSLGLALSFVYMKMGFFLAFSIKVKPAGLTEMVRVSV